jgi:DTW domain-containing protein YfiP
MHPKEFKKVKNGTGHLTHLSLKNSELFIGIDFTNHKEINEIIATHESFVLYPSKDAINLSDTNSHATFPHPKSTSSLTLTAHANQFPHAKKMAIFIIDSTWACSLKMLRESKNLQALKHISFESTKLSQFKIKEQPAEYCLSTIESTLEVLELLNVWHVERLEKEDLAMFLNPFHTMIAYQLECIENSSRQAVRF